MQEQFARQTVHVNLGQWSMLLITGSIYKLQSFPCPYQDIDLCVICGVTISLHSPVKASEKYDTENITKSIAGVFEEIYTDMSRYMDSGEVGNGVTRLGLCWIRQTLWRCCNK